MNINSAINNIRKNISMQNILLIQEYNIETKKVKKERYLMEGRKEVFYLMMHSLFNEIRQYSGTQV